MAIKSIVKLDNKWKRFISGDDFERLIEKQLLEEGIKKQISLGYSPVKFKGRFTAYKFSRLGHGYPRTPQLKAKFPNKKLRPVNLSLSGSYLNSFGVRKVKYGVFEVGIMKPSSLNKKMFETHNLGLHPHVPERKHLPTLEGENFSDKIWLNFTKAVEKQLRFLKIID
jgi:hypothetical protein